MYTIVRGINIPTIQIKQIEDEYGAKLVEDKEADLIKSLDMTLQRHLARTGKMPDVIVLTDMPGEIFRFKELKINFLGLEIPGGYMKPAWFRFKKQFTKGSPQRLTNGKNN